ncbi:hypothetical protein [Methylomonas sp. AM2-LC]|uniref:hypothetical protein n=1 Tax=Methylomonas sp. AM2-LC TaxID=3153301 RepID=UPI003267437C
MSTKTTKYNAVLHRAIQTSLAGSLLLACMPAVSYALGVSLTPDTLVLTSSKYTGTASAIPALLPSTNATTKIAAVTTSSAYPSVFLNAGADASFGITSPIYLSLVNSTNGYVQKTIDLTALAASKSLDFVTSFPSKSELSVNLSSDGVSALTLVGYSTTSGLLDVSNSNTPGLIDTTNPTYGFSAPTYRNIMQLNNDGTWFLTNTNGYSGNNGRTAILDSTNNQYYMAGNAGNAGKPAPAASVLAQLSSNTGVQTIAAGSTSPNTSVIGNLTADGQHGFTVNSINPLTGLVYGPSDKVGKDDNFRGATVYKGTMYVSKGSGGNGINTVYQVGNVGDFGAGNLSGTSPITVLPGFPADLASVAPTHYPFGMWFANPTTLYVADEGGTKFPYAATGNEGIEKWVLNTTTGVWSNVYTLQNGLGLGVPYTVTGTALDGSTGSYTTTTGGVRHIVGSLHADGTVNLYATTSTVSDATIYGDQGADPNRLVSIKDVVNATALPTTEKFTVLKTAAYGEVFRGVNIMPATHAFVLPK